MFSCLRGCAQEQEGGTYKATMALPPAHIVEKGKQEAIEAGQRAIVHSGAQMVRDNNPLGLPQGKDGILLELRVVLLQGAEERETHIRCNAFCTYLANQSELVQAFNGLSHVHQILALLLHEPREDEPHSVKEWFLWATGLQQHAAWQAITSNDGVLDIVQRESRLQHIEVFFQERGQYGTSERMRPACPDSICSERQEKQ